MWRELDMQDRILELDASSPALIDQRADGILDHYPEALKKAQAASELAVAISRKAMEQIRSILAEI